MPISAVVTEHPEEASIRLEISAPVLLTSVRVYRNEESGAVEVRGSPFRIDGAGVLYDYEPPFDTSLTYLITGSGETDYTTEEVELVSDDTDWLKSLSNPSQSQPVYIESWVDKKRSGRVSLYQVHGRKMPVAVTDVMSGPESTVILVFLGQASWETTDRALDDGYPMLLHCAPSHGEDRTYFVVNQASWSRPFQLASQPERRLALDITEVDSTRLILGPTESAYLWEELEGDYADWAAVVAAFTTWRRLTLTGLSLPGA